MRIEEIFRAEYGRILATLIRLLGDFDVAEEALQEAFAVGGRAVAGGRHADESGELAGLHRAAQGDRPDAPARALAQKQEEIARHFELSAEEEDAPMPEDRLRLIFTCCHPALAIEAQVALTLRTLGGCRPRRSRAPSWCPRRPWRSGSCAPRPRSAARAFPTRCRPTRRSPSGSRR